jgi:O-antigen ligase
MILAALALLLIGAQLFSSSRAAFAVTVAVSVGLVVLMMRGRWRSRRQIMQALGIGAAIGVLVIGVAGSAMLRKVALSGEVATWERLVIWRTSLQATEASPWLGWGLGTFPDVFLVYQPEDTGKAYDKAHSTPVELYVETGILGTVPGLGMALIPLGVCLWGALRRRHNRHLVVAAVTVPAVAMLHSTVDFSIQMPAIAFMSAAFLGMGWAQTFDRTSGTRQIAA